MRAFVLWVIVGISALLLWQIVRSTPAQQAEQRTPEISYSQFMSEAEAGHIANVSVTGTKIQGQYRDGKTFHLIGPSNPGVYVDVLRGKGVEVWFKDSSEESSPMRLLGTWAPLILLAAIWFYMIRQMQRRRGATPLGTNSGPYDQPK